MTIYVQFAITVAFFYFSCRKLKLAITTTMSIDKHSKDQQDWSAPR